MPIIGSRWVPHIPRGEDGKDRERRTTAAGLTAAVGRKNQVAIATAEAKTSEPPSQRNVFCCVRPPDLSTVTPIGSPRTDSISMRASPIDCNRLLGRLVRQRSSSSFKRG